MSTTEPPRIARFTVRRFARCAVRGPSDPAAVRELWIVLHGYGQLATDFAATFGPQNVDDGTRLIVAPEGLSRFYDARSKPDAHAEASVGASWMTREDRSFEIEDQIAWLQQAFEAFVGPLPRSVPVTVLGFSQGVAAASRWVASGKVCASRLICWGAGLAPELDLGPASPLRQTRLYLVLGNRDHYASPEKVRAERARLDAAQLPCRFLTFDGGHRLDDDTLRAIAADATPS